MRGRVVSKLMRKASRYYQAVLRPQARVRDAIADQARVRNSSALGALFKTVDKAPRGGRR